MATLLLFKSMLYANAIRTAKTKKKMKRKASTLKSKKLDLTLCRVCNADKGDIPIFNNLSQPNIPEDIHNFSGVMVNESDNLPKSMCQSCLDLLNGCIMFREMCQKNNQYLVELSLKKEQSCEDNQTRQEEHNLSDESSNIPSPAFSDSEPWDCATCHKQFYDLKSYNSHLSECKKRKGERKAVRAGSWKPTKSFLCDICGKTAKSKASLLVHMGIHENVFPFKCDQCPYQGRTMDLLKVHKRSHLADKPFKCSQCPKATTTSSNLAKHMRHVHTTNRPYKCQYCDKAFSYQHDMKRHIKDIHLRQGTVDCDLCFKKFNTKKILQGHRWKIHKIKGERQGRLPSYLQCRPEESDVNCDPDLNY